MILSFKEQVRIFAKRHGLKMGDICQTLGTTRQNLNQKLNRDNLTREDMQALADALGCDLVIRLTERGGSGEE